MPPIALSLAKLRPDYHLVDCDSVRLVQERRKASEFVERDWSCFEAAAIVHWREVARLQGPTALLAIGDELRQHAISQNPDWPTPGDRARDFKDHLKLIEILDRVSARRR
jgi:hypothetical protein